MEETGYASMDEAANFNDVLISPTCRAVIAPEFPKAHSNPAPNCNGANKDERTLLQEIVAVWDATKLELRFRPCYTLAEGASVVSIVFALIGFADSWVTLKAGDIDGSRVADGAVKLLSMQLCSRPDSGRTSTVNARYCTLVELSDVATTGSYLRNAGGVSWASLLVALPALIACWAVVRARRKESIDDSFLLLRLPALRSHAGGAAVCWAAQLSLLVAWGTYLDTLKRTFDGAALATILAFPAPISATPGPALVLCALAWTCSMLASLLVTFYPVEPSSWRDWRAPSIGTLPSANRQGAGVGERPVADIFVGLSFSGSKIEASTNAGVFALWGSGNSQPKYRAAGDSLDAFAGIAADPSSSLLVEHTDASSSSVGTVIEL